MKYPSTNIREIISDIKEHKLLSSLSEEAIIRYTDEFIGILGLEGLYEDKIATIEIENYRGALPDDFIEILGVRSYLKDATEEQLKHFKPIYYRATNDIFYKSTKHHFTTPNYKITGKVIYTSVKSTVIQIAYKAIELDDCGMPLIPDNAKFKRALKAYIKLRRFTDLFDTEEISPRVFEQAQQDYAWAVGACETEFMMPTYDEAESMMNNQGQSLIRDRHKVGFADIGEKDYNWVQ